jgi:hypothetical protein
MVTCLNEKHWGRPKPDTCRYCREEIKEAEELSKQISERDALVKKLIEKGIIKKETS